MGERLYVRQQWAATGCGTQTVRTLSDVEGAKVVKEVEKLLHKERIDGAAALTGFGCQVIPIKAGSNKPPLEKNWRNRATSDPAEVRSWLRRFPNCNVGIVTGKASGLFVVDIDKGHGGGDGEATLAALEAEYGPLPRTAAVRTPRGGTHLYFKQPEARPIRNSAGKLGIGIDVRGDGGYIAAAGSRRPDGEYTYINSPFEHEIAEAPAWLLDRADPLRVPPTAGRQQSPTISTLDRWLYHSCMKVTSAAPGTRNDVLNAEMFRMMCWVNTGRLDLQKAATELACAALAAGLPMPEIKATLASAMRGRAHHG